MTKIARVSILTILSSLAIGAFAQDGGAKNIQDQINDLKAEISALKNTAQQQSENTASTKSAKSVPVVAGQQYFFWDNNLTTPYGLVSSSRYPFSFFKDRNDFPDQSLTIGAKTEFDATQWWGSSVKSASGDHYQSGKAIALTDMEMYFTSNLGHFVQANVTFFGTSTSGANVSIENAFITFGNLDTSPVYLTLGKMRLSFGSFATGGPWVAGLNQGLFRPGFGNVAANLGFYKDGINLNAAYFQSDSQTSDFMLSAFYDGHHNKFNYGGDAAYMYNWVGASIPGASYAGKSAPTLPNGGLAKTVNTNRNGLVNLEGYFGYDIYSLNAGWTGTTQKEDYSNNSRLGAWYLQSTISPVIAGQTTSFAVGYQHAYNTQNLPFPLAGDENKGPSIVGAQNEILAYVSRPMFFKNNYVSLEYAYITTYTHQHTNELTLDVTTNF